MKTFTAVVVVVCLFVLSEAITYKDEEPENLRDECKVHFDRSPYVSSILLSVSNNKTNLCKFWLNTTQKIYF